MNVDLITLIVFYSVILLLFLRYKHKFTIQGIMVLYKTGIGLKLMDRLAKLNPKLLRFLSVSGTVIGFIGMTASFAFLVKETIKFLLVPDAVTAIAPLLPGISIPGVPTLSFWHWIIAIFIVGTVHEFSHGVIARFYKVPIKSSGMAFLGPVMAAFVEPDDKAMNKAKPMDQVGILSAGAFSNIMLGIVFFLLFNFVTAPLFVESIRPDGISVNTVEAGYPAYEQNISAPFTLISVNDKNTTTASQFVNATTGIKPGDTVVLGTNCGTYELIAAEHPKNKSIGYIGLGGLEQNLAPAGIAEGRPWAFSAISWFNMLVMWLFVINLGLALFNFLPFIPADGGRMLLVTLTSLFPRKGRKIWFVINFTCLTLVVINLLPWVFKLLAWLFKIFVMVISFGAS